ncbi:MAG: aspartate-semialdehyde dehydrogenase [Clostridiales bacterium]|nr:aspartate-semialdehyde dehydrogenase [Clostridiales bacterium]
MKKQFSVAVVGATGLVGQTMLKVLHERNFPVSDVILYAFNSGEAHTPFGTKEVYELSGANIYRRPCDFALFAVSNEVSIKYAQIFSTMGAIVIDNSSAWRMDDNVPLVIPEVNPSSAFMHSGIIANPNCTTAQILTAMAPIHREFGIVRMIVSTYQSVSGAGAAALADLQSGECNVFDLPIKNNLLPKIDTYHSDGYTGEELKIVNETHKILSSRIKVNATSVRVPITNCHGATVNFKLTRTANLSEISECLMQAPSVKLLDIPTPLDAVGQDNVLVGRLRRDESEENSFCLWTVADNLRKGAATNAVQIAELLI